MQAYALALMRHIEQALDDVFLFEVHVSSHTSICSDVIVGLVPRHTQVSETRVRVQMADVKEDAVLSVTAGDIVVPLWHDTVLLRDRCRMYNIELMPGGGSPPRLLCALVPPPLRMELAVAPLVFPDGQELRSSEYPVPLRLPDIGSITRDVSMARTRKRNAQFEEELMQRVWDPRKIARQTPDAQLRMLDS
jgi:hypothetical protein